MVSQFERLHSFKPNIKDSRVFAERARAIAAHIGRGCGHVYSLRIPLLTAYRKSPETTYAPIPLGTSYRSSPGTPYVRLTPCASHS